MSMYEEEPFIDDVEVVGSGRIPVLVIPGLASSRVDFNKLSQLMPERKFHIAMNPWIQGQLLLSDNLEYMDSTWLNGIREQIDSIRPVELIGHSKGVPDVLRLMKSLRRSSIQRLMLLNPPTNKNGVTVDKNTRFRNKPDQVNAFIYSFLALLTTGINDDEFVKMCKEHEAEYGSKIEKILDIIKLARINTEELKVTIQQLQLPALVVAGGKDPLNDQSALLQLFRGKENVDIHTIEEGDHFTHRSAPEEIATAWSEWISQKVAHV